MAAGTTVSILPCGAMTADLTWLLPVVPAAIVNNLEQFYSSVEKLRGIATEASATVVFGHDPDQIKELRTAPEGSYR